MEINGWLPLIILVFEVALIPFAWKILEALNKISGTSERFAENLGVLCQELKKVSEELIEARIRDKDIQSDLEKIKHELRLHVDDERRKQ